MTLFFRLQVTDIRRIYSLPMPLMSIDRRYGDDMTTFNQFFIKSHTHVNSIIVLNRLGKFEEWSGGWNSVG